jgi:hypothetical protein
LRGIERRLTRLEAASHPREEALVSPETLRKMAAVHDAECARIREKLFADGPHVPIVDRPGVESEARRRLREKLLGPDVAPAAERARA